MKAGQQNKKRVFLAGSFEQLYEETPLTKDWSAVREKERIERTSFSGDLVHIDIKTGQGVCNIRQLWDSVRYESI